MYHFILHNLMLWLPEQDSPTLGWVSVAAGKIEQIGAGSPPPYYPIPMLNLGGAHLLPGLVDAHRHFHFMSLLPKMRSGAQWQSAAEALEEIAYLTSVSAPDEWTIFTFVDHSKWKDSRPISLYKLDAVSNGRKVLLIDVTLHRGMASSAALVRSGIVFGNTDFGEDVDRKEGIMTGLIWEAAFGRVLNCVVEDVLKRITDEEYESLLENEAERTLSQGIVALHDPGLGVKAQESLAKLQTVTALRLNWSATSEKGLFELAEASELERFIPPKWGQKSVKIFLDGANRCAACLPLGIVLRSALKAGYSSAINLSAAPLRRLLEPKVKISGFHAHLPYLRFNNIESLVEKCRAYVDMGFSLKIHALGNEAATQACELLRTVNPPHASIEHVMALYDHEVHQIASSKAYIGIQPGFIPYYASAIEEQGVSSVMRVFPTSSLLKSSGKVVISSDAPCGNDDPLHNLRRAVDRKKNDGSELMPDEALSRSQAINAMSFKAAKSIGLVPHGLYINSEANFTICSGDPFAEETEVLETWIAGKPVWRKPKTIRY
ncbi:hypothetical protein DY954_07560 [Pseudomonas aeruginosa]|uniref:amidohydrolase family protein n=1 Tax=Pseudomonadaceae TaxID=135621 RepID=UPI000F818CE4|nr:MULTISPECIES: amidohydrolase family protein [Pseudomonas aeruginosa group]MDH2200047.1 amidohydrolase family protein [Pseudomonas oleovorans]RTT13485.1 hypothetical protein DY954_07560 [Pseudomonas aeruginosa]